MTTVSRALNSGGRRLFLSIRPPASILASLAGYIDRIEMARWGIIPVPEDKQHITLHFLGNLDPEREAALATSLEKVAGGWPAFSLLTADYALFPSRSRPQCLVLQLHPENPDQARMVHGSCAAILRDCGIAPESRPWRPHITLGRFRPGLPEGRRIFSANESENRPGDGDYGRNAGSLSLFAAIFRSGLMHHRIVAQQIELTLSEPLPGGSRYTEISSFRLGMLSHE